MTIGVHELKTMDFSDVTSKGTLPPVSSGEITAGKRAITPGTDLRLCRLFELSDGWWLRLQADYDVARAKPVMSNVLASITPVAYGG